VQAQLLDTKAHRALLDLYALDSRLSSSRDRVAALATRSERLRAAQVALAQQLGATRRTLAISQEALAQHLRDLYEQGGADPLAVVLGASSLEEALARLDDLSRVADQRRRVVAATSQAQQRLVRLRTALATRRRALTASLAAARQGERALAAAVSERASYVASLRSQARLKRAQVGALEMRARSVELRSQQLQAAAQVGAGTTAQTTDTSPAATAENVGETAAQAPAETQAPVPAAAPSASASGRTLTVYTTGYSLPGTTSTGMPVGWGVVAVDPAVIPLGTRLTIPGYGEGVAADTGSAVRGARIDLWFPSLAQARAWGRRTVTITLH
jgi:3D (Asp-Asp-Asp) domain-containing protein